MTRAPAWLLIATIAMAAALLVMSVTETSFKGQYLIDQGESLSLVGLVFILGAGLYLHRQRRLYPSLPLVLPWLIYPVITQGDQIIDNLSINPMRWVVHILLALIFAAPAAVIVFAVRQLAGGRQWAKTRRGTALLMTALLVGEIWIAYGFLGTLMIVTLIILIAGTLYWGFATGGGAGDARPASPAVEARVALVTLVAGVIISGGLYLGFKNRPGAYQGSPSFYMDLSQADQSYSLSRVHVPPGAPAAPASPGLLRDALSGYGRTLEKLLAGYYILDRNYNYHFHNELFLRSTPLLPNYRQAGLSVIADASRLRAGADAAAGRARATLAQSDPLVALLDDVQGYTAYSFDRAATLERLSAEFEGTKAGLQHATHIYEGEGKFLGVQLAALVDKHHGVLTSPVVMAETAEFLSLARAIHDKYADRIVGF